MQSLPFMDSTDWTEVRQDILQMILAVEHYCLHLRVSSVKNKVARETPRNEIEEKAKFKVLKVNNGLIHPALSKLDKHLEDVQMYNPISVREFLPTHCDRVYDVIEELKRNGLKCNCVHYTHHVGGNRQSLHFISKIDEAESASDTIQKCLPVITKMEADMPIYEKRITKQQFMHAFGFVAKPVALRAIFQDLTRDASAPTNLNVKAFDDRFKYAMECEDAAILVDLRNQPPENQTDTFKDFFAETEKYLSEEIGVACHERRHGEQLYLAKAVSIKDLHQRIKERVPPGTNVPSVKWLRYQFQPINPKANTAKYFKGKLNVKMMVQKRQVLKVIFI